MDDQRQKIAETMVFSTYACNRRFIENIGVKKRRKGCCSDYNDLKRIKKGTDLYSQAGER